MAFGGGVLMSALTFDLMEEASVEGNEGSGDGSYHACGPSDAVFLFQTVEIGERDTAHRGGHAKLRMPAQ